MQPRAGNERLQAIAEAALIATGALVQLFLYPHLIWGDGTARYANTVALAGGALTAGKYPLLQSVLTLPLRALGSLIHSPDEISALFSQLVFFAGCWALWRLLRGELEEALLRRFLLLLFAASMFPHHIQTYYGETLTAFALAAALCARQTAVSAPLAVAAILATPATAPAVLLGGRRRALALAAGAGLALVALENTLRRGAPWLTGYEGDHYVQTLLPYSARPTFGVPFLLGLPGHLISPGKGLLFFAPGLLLLVTARPAQERVRAVLGAWLLALAALVAVYSKWFAWAGGWFWGPRFLLFASFPACLAIAAALGEERASRLRRVATALLLAASVWVGFEGAVFGQHAMELCTSDPKLEVLCWWVPEFSALFRPFIVPRALSPRELVIAAWFCASLCVLGWPLLRRSAGTAVDQKTPPSAA